MEVLRAGDELSSQWDDFVANNASDGGFLQSWKWGDFQKSLGRTIFRLAVLDEEGDFAATALLIKNEIHFEYNYLYCPRGPIKADSSQGNKALIFLIDEIKKIAKEEKSFLVRIDPAWFVGNETLATNFGFRKSEKEIQPKCTLIVDITKNEDEVLADMKQKTRYNVNLAAKKGVKVNVSQEILDIESFWQLVKQTSERDGFHPHPKEYYKKMFEMFSESGALKLYLAEYEGKIIAANLMAFFGQVCIYLHGSSADMYRGVMAPYLLHWQAIQDAKKTGMTMYDLGGLNGKTFYSEKWEGITRFKTGFAPETNIKEFIGSYELVTNPLIFSVYKFVKQIRG